MFGKFAIAMLHYICTAHDFSYFNIIKAKVEVYKALDSFTAVVKSSQENRVSPSL